MKNLRYAVVAVGIACMTLAARAQGPGWEQVKVGKITLRYPPTWQVDSGRDGGETNITLTPDSMRDLNMRMCVIFALPADSSQDFADLEKHFTAMIESSVGPDANFLKTADTILKAHKSMYAEVTLRALPMKVYGFCDEVYDYIILFTQRRYFQVADPRLERDEAAILKSITFGH